MSILDRFIGPRVDLDGDWRDRSVYLAPSAAFGLAAVLLIVSIFQPYWRMKLEAPQYPGGLVVEARLDRLDGDVEEIDGLNHYIGMRPLGEAAQLERELSVIAVSTISLLVLSAIYIHTRWAAVLCLPTVLFPLLFLADLAFWLRNFGTHLDPKAPLSSSIEPFVPPVLGRGIVGQFATVASAGPGLLLASTASILVLAGLFLHRRAYKPLVDEAP